MDRRHRAVTPVAETTAKRFGPVFCCPAPYRVKPVDQHPAIQKQRKLTTMNTITLLVYVLTVTAPAPAPTPTPTTPTAASSTNNCWCQSIPLKDWGK
jgi:hypothetical protein